MLVDSDTAAVIGAATGLACALVNYGIMKATVTNLNERQNKTEGEIASLEEKFVPYREFQSTGKHLEESLKRIETNVRKLTEFLLERPTGRTTRQDADS